MSFDELKNVNGLVCAIAQDSGTGEVLMQAYMNRESFEETLRTGYMHYYSRSRKKLWKKGETSGHVQKVVELYTDCDSDCILAKVVQTGFACHTMRKTCFYKKII